MAKCIMIQGTASSVGKSIVAAGLCRVFKQDSFSVAPFKSQNMALNSFITKDGKEMGRAQVVQAEAAGIEPSADMNPILLKPTTDQKSQVIIAGKVYKNMSAAQYHDFKPELAGLVRDAYNRLAASHDVIVIEGAGSPAEINLREKDFVNMGMAEIADAPVILVGDIDKGGVFAALAGTMLLLSEEERTRVKGVVINKFRGDLDILKPGLKMLEDIIHIPVIGVLPYTKLEIDDEDSLAEKFTEIKKVDSAFLDVAVIMLPHISNFTDFNALEQTEGVMVRYVHKTEELNEPDLILLPGTKNTIEDLVYIRKIGMEEAIKNLNQKGTVLFGICGGLQMLGKSIKDPDKTECDLLELDGMGLLDTSTTFMKDKVTRQATGIISNAEGIITGLDGVEVNGYEIHMGITSINKNSKAFIRNCSDNHEEAEAIGIRNLEGTVFGTYIHGIFDNAVFTSAFINNLRSRKGMSKIKDSAFNFNNFKEQQYEKLALMLRENLDMVKIYKILDGQDCG